MKRLSQHILSLLRLYDTVVLPELGVYVMEYMPSYIDRESFRIYPPRYKVTFTGNSFSSSRETDSDEFEILSADNRLLDSYIRKERITPEEAWSLLKADIADFRTYLDAGGSPYLEEFNMLNPPYPVLPIRSLRIKPTADEKDEENSNADTGSVVQNWRNPDYYYIPVHKKLAKIAACLLLVVMVSLVATLPFGRSGNSASTASIVPIPVGKNSSVEITPVHPTITSPDTEIPAIIDDDTVPGAGSLTSTPFVRGNDNDEAKYYAVVAAFKTEKEAHKFIDSHKGDKSRFVIIKNSKYYLISAASGSEKHELEANLPLIRSDYPDVWILSLN